MKKTKLLTCLIATFLILMTGVNAEELNSATCKEGQKYTYYFYFSVAHNAEDIKTDIANKKYDSLKDVFKGEISSSTSVSDIPKLIDNVTLSTILNDKAKYNQGTGVIYVNNSDTKAYTNLKLQDYWKKVAEINKSGKIYVINDNKEVHLLHGAFAGYKGDTQLPYKDSVIDLFNNDWSESKIEALTKASIQIKNTQISYQVDNINSTGLQLHLKRDYTDSSDSTGSSDFSNLVAINGTIYENANDTTGTNASWYLQPAVYYIEVCEKKVTNDFTITYDADGGEDAPAAQKGKAGECVKISDVKPKKENETFLGWYLKSNPSSTDKKYVAGDEYCGENGDITLYAQYTGDTGVEEYFGAFIAVVLIAGGILVLSNKKRLFKQI